VRIVAGDFWGKKGPVEGVAADPRYLDVWIPPRVRKTIPVESLRNAFAYVFEGNGTFRDASGPQGVQTDRVSAGGRDAGTENKFETGNRSLVVFDSGDEITVQAGEQGMRFLLVSGQPLQEPVAWQGPIVMNTREELLHAYDELRQGTFIKKG
jgi:redox-sensitive bicupin YhaK (pirin superfamily)